MTGPVAPAGRATPVVALLQRAASTPHQVAVRVFESGLWVEYGWDDVARTVARLAALVATAGVGPGSTVGLACGSRVEWSLSVWAVNGLGATVCAVGADADRETLQTVLATEPALWILEGAQPHDGLDALGVTGTPRLVIDALDLPREARRGLHEWERDVLGPVGSDDATRLADLNTAAGTVDPESVALRLPEEGDLGFTHAELLGDRDVADESGPPRARLIPGDEYLAFLPPGWAAEARLLAGDHPGSGAVVSYGSRTGGGLREVATVQPTVLQAPASWWAGMAATLIRSAAEPAPLAKGPLNTILAGGGEGFGVRLARRILTRRFGLARLRTAHCLGGLDAPDAQVLAGLGVPFGPLLDPPGPLRGVPSPSGSAQPEEAR